MPKKIDISKIKVGDKKMKKLVLEDLRDGLRLEIKFEILRRYNNFTEPEIVKSLLAACKKAKEYLYTSSKLDWDNVLTPILEKAIAQAEAKK